MGIEKVVGDPKVRKVKRILLSVVVVVAGLAGLNRYAQTQADVPEIEGPPIVYDHLVYDHLANQETDPFMFSGNLMNGEHARWPQYRRAIGQFQDVRDCLVDEERGKDNPNLLLIDWQHLKKRRNIEVCLFRIFRSLNSISLIRKWLEFHEFQNIRYSRIFSETYIPQSQTEPVAGIFGSWSAEETLNRLPTFMWRVFGWTLLQGTSITVKLSESGEIVGVGLSYTYE